MGWSLFYAVPPDGRYGLFNNYRNVSVFVNGFRNDFTLVKLWQKFRTYEFSHSSPYKPVSFVINRYHRIFFNGFLKFVNSHFLSFLSAFWLVLLCSLQVLLYHIRRNSSRLFRNFFQKKWAKIARNFVEYFVHLDKYKKV